MICIGAEKERSKIMKFEVCFVVVVCDDELEGSVVVGNNEMSRKVALSPDLTLEVPDISR
jgi:hypothetical protein